MKTNYLLIGIFLYLINCSVGLSQTVDYDNSINDSVTVQLNDTITNILDSLYQSESRIPDSLREINKSQPPNLGINVKDTATSIKPEKQKQAFITSKVEYNSNDSTIFSVDGQKVFLFGKAEVNYEDIKLTAAYIEVDMSEGIIYAEGMKDSVGNPMDEPVFIQGSDEIKAKNITYNIQTSKGYVKGLYTQQDDGYLHSSQTKIQANNHVNLHKGKYTTCDLEDPHFYLWISKGKVVPQKAIVSSFSFLVIEDVPLYPLMIPFGFFPNTKEKASGFLIPKFGEEKNRGFYLREGGYYFAFSDYADLAVKGDVYSKGSWQIGATSKYKVRYKFGGNVNLGYSKVAINQGLENYSESNQYRVVWSHTQDAKARPNSNFSANVNFTSMDDNRYNATNSQQYLTNTTSSSISYRKTFANTPFSMSMNLRHSQNTTNKTVNLTLPQITMNMSRVFPFRRKAAVGKKRWYEDIGITYAGNFENKSKGLHDSVMFKNEMWDYFNNGLNHKIPLSTSFKVLKYFNLSPSINFTDRMYFKRDIRTYMADSTGYTTEEETGFYNLYDYSYSLGLGTTIYGMYQYKSKWLKAIRHVATPSVSMSYRPDFSDEKYGFYVPIDTSNQSIDKNGNYTGPEYYNPYEKYQLYGMPSFGKSGTVSFSLNNNLEMKVADKNDTTSTDATKKIKLLESLNFSTSYNLIADSLNWAPISLSGRTTLFKGLSINVSASADLYGLDSAGRRLNVYENQMSGKPFRLTNMRLSTGYSFNSKDLFGTNNDEEDDHHHQHYDGYDYFDIPWDFRVDYSYNYSKTGLEPNVNQTMSFSGNFSLTPKWKVGFRSGWDFNAKDFSYTSFNLSRDLHCWMATLNLVPFGERQSFNFTIGVKSSVLQDLKYDKNQSWQDNYAY